MSEATTVFQAADGDRLRHLAAIVDANPKAITDDGAAELYRLAEKTADALDALISEARKSCDGFLVAYVKERFGA